ncbi:MAG: DUF1700 domain-containing protein [Ruminiclostridium sp.]|nr:DUF1700 domain-containing protein [Ruminiclostridium sp.]
MICTTKTEFLSSLRVALENNNVADSRDILTDFRQHFEDGEVAGETEEEVCRKLGDIDEIIKQYISEDAEKKANEPDTSGFGASEAQAAPPPPPQYGNVQYASPQYAAPKSDAFTPSAGKITGTIILDVFVFSWALPALAGIIVALIGVAVSFVCTGLAVFVAGALSFFVDLSGFIVTGFVPLSLVFFGIMLTALGGMLVIASVCSVRGFINICISIVNMHAKVFTGRKPFHKIGRSKEVE